jgi:hypothetical protein
MLHSGGTLLALVLTEWSTYIYMGSLLALPQNVRLVSQNSLEVEHTTLFTAVTIW